MPKKCNPLLAVEITVNLICVPPGVNHTFIGEMNGGSYEYSLTDIFLVVMILRLYLVLRVYKHYSR